MLAGATSATVLACFSPCSLQSTSNKNWIPRISVFKNPQNPFAVSHKIQSLTIPSAFLPRFNPKASSSKSVGSAEYKEEPATKSKFFTSFNLPGCSNSFILLGTGYREKVFAIIGVKVYAAGLYAAQSVLNNMNAWRGQSAAEIEKNSSLFNALYQDPSEKSLQIILVRDIDGKTFWDALDEAISPRMKSPSSVDKSALLAFRTVFEGQPLKKGTCIFLTWVDPSKMLVSVSSDGIPSVIDATIESTSVTSALFDVFFGDSPVSPSLKASVADGLAAILK